MSTLIVTLALSLFAASDGGVPDAPSSPSPRSSRPATSLLAPPRTTPPPADRAYELRRATDGTGDLVYDGPGFRARIARDGTARFEDKHLTLIRSWSLLPFAPLPTPKGQPTLQSSLEDLMARRNPRRGARTDPRDPTPEPTPLRPRMSRARPDPDEACTYPRGCYFEAGLVVVGVGGTFDLTDELMRLGGEDPYRREKAHFLAATGDLRRGLGARALAENLRRATKELPAQLDRIACDPTLTIRERRALIEALRHEMDGDAPAARDAVAVIAAFLAARFDAADGGASCAPRLSPP